MCHPPRVPLKLRQKPKARTRSLRRCSCGNMSDVVRPVQFIPPHVLQTSGMTFKIGVACSGPVTTVRFIGNLRPEDVKELKRRVELGGRPIILGLAGRTLVDLREVRFLIGCEKQGAQIANGSLYIWKWMRREREEE
jgi:hypothetical protein